MTYNQNGVKTVLEWLHWNEPQCRCDHCIYLLDKEKCEEERKKVQEQHLVWEAKVKKWEDRLIINE